jgi:hypothetical protein
VGFMFSSVFAVIGLGDRVAGHSFNWRWLYMWWDWVIERREISPPLGPSTYEVYIHNRVLNIAVKYIPGP